MPTNPKFNEAKERIINAAQRVAGAYLLSKYGSAHLSGEPKVELTATEGPTSSSFVFKGQITCYAADSLLNQVGVNMTINENDIEVTSEDIQANISGALNAAEEHSEVVVASLDSFNLTDTGSKYLQVSHSALQDANLGIVGKNEYAASKDKSALLQGIVKDAMLETPITFTGEFKEPTIEKAARLKDCWECGKEYDDKNKYQDDLCDKCRGAKPKKEASLVEPKIQPKKSSWITADFMSEPSADPFTEFTAIVQKQYGVTPADMGIDGPEAMPMDEAPQELADRLGMKYDMDKIADSDVNIGNPMGVKDDMPMARATDSMAQMAQLESQTLSASKEKLTNEAANALISMLHGMGYGTAKIAEVTDSKDGLDFMAAVDDGGSVKAVSIPVAIKESKVVLPKKALVSTLISKGLDIRAKLSEQFDLEALEKIAAIEEKIAYETKEAEDILAERPVKKEASGSTNEMFLGETDVLEVQKHLLPNHEEMKKGDKISDGADQWELVDTDSNQNDKNEDSASIWKFKKCAPPKADEKEPETKIKA